MFDKGSFVFDKEDLVKTQQSAATVATYFSIFAMNTPASPSVVSTPSIAAVVDAARKNSPGTSRKADLCI